MTKQEILNKAKIEYQSLKQEQEEINKIKARISELKQDEKVKEYFRLMDELAMYEELSKEEIYHEAFSEIEDKDKLDKIYLYCGLYIKNKNFDERDFRIREKDYNRADYLSYVNIFDFYDVYNILPAERESFEREHFVLRQEDFVSVDKLYYKLQDYYYQLLLTTECYNSDIIMEKLNEKVKELTK